MEKHDLLRESWDDEGKPQNVRLLLGKNPKEIIWRKRFGVRGLFAFSGSFNAGSAPCSNTKITRITGWRIHYCVPQAEKRGPACYRSSSVEPRTVETVKTCAVLTPRPRESLDLAATRFQVSSKLKS
jgi:hypothetical protein